MLDHWLRIAVLLRLVSSSTTVRVMDFFVVETFQLWHPLANIFAAGVESLALAERIEDAEVWLRVNTNTGTESPTAAVAGKVSIDQVLHEVLFASAPIDEQILGEK